jgi:hypothetical protein
VGRGRKGRSPGPHRCVRRPGEVGRLGHPSPNPGSGGTHLEPRPPNGVQPRQGIRWPWAPTLLGDRAKEPRHRNRARPAHPPLPRYLAFAAGATPGPAGLGVWGGQPGAESGRRSAPGDAGSGPHGGRRKRRSAPPACRTKRGAPLPAIVRPRPPPAEREGHHRGEGGRDTPLSRRNPARDTRPSASSRAPRLPRPRLRPSHVPRGLPECRALKGPGRGRAAFPSGSSDPALRPARGHPLCWNCTLSQPPSCAQSPPQGHPRPAHRPGDLPTQWRGTEPRAPVSSGGRGRNAALSLRSKRPGGCSGLSPHPPPLRTG